MLLDKTVEDDDDGGMGSAPSVFAQNEQTSSANTFVPPPFEMFNPHKRGCRAMGPSALKDIVERANARITAVEKFCELANAEIARLQLTQTNKDQKFSYACEQLNELQRELDENTVTLHGYASLIDDYRNDRVVPTDIMQESEQGEMSSIVHQTLSTITDKNAQICALKQALESLSAPSSSSSTVPTSSTHLVNDCSESLARLATYMKKRDYTMDTQKMLEYSSQRYVSELASEGGDQFLVFLMTVLDKFGTFRSEINHIL
jgi:ribonuclease HI